MRSQSAPFAARAFSVITPVSLLLALRIDPLDGWFVALPVFLVGTVIGVGVLQGSRIAWFFGLGTAALATVFVGFLIQRYNSPVSVPGTVMVLWSGMTYWMIVHAVAGFVLLLWPSTRAWVQPWSTAASA
jgi:hypothetical protein